MRSTLLRIFLGHNLLNTILLYLVPKKLRRCLSQLLGTPKHPPTTLPPPLDISKTTLPPPSQPSSSSSSSSLSPSSPSACVPRRMEPGDLRRVFQMFDKNGDGRITKKELNDSFENIGIFIPDPELSQMIEKMDVNGDGCVDIEEFGVLYQSITEERNEEEDMREAFNVFDKNGDGFITVDELRSVLSSLGLKQGKTMEDCRRMIAKVDVDGDGRVNFNEFRHMMRGGGFAALN